MSISVSIWNKLRKTNRLYMLGFENGVAKKNSVPDVNKKTNNKSILKMIVIFVISLLSNYTLFFFFFYMKLSKCPYMPLNI